MSMRFAPRVLVLLTLASCGGIEIDLPELDTGDLDVDGGDLAGDLDDGFTTIPADDGDDDDDDDDDDDGDDDGPGSGDCCEAHDTPGCEDEAVAACVCEEDPFCCATVWDGICVLEVTDLECGACEPADTGHDDDGDDDDGDDDDGDDDVADDGDDDVGEVTTDDGTDDGGTEGPCCEPHDAPGCEYRDVESCVCVDDPFCCEVTWDESCVAEVDVFGCGVCSIGDDDGTSDDGGDDDVTTDDGGTDEGTDDGGSTGPCCEPHESTGCEYPEVEDCVCLTDPFCCEVQWDGLCVDEVGSLGCGVC
jgi:hypothetical protein